MLKFGCKVTNFYSFVQIFSPKKHSNLHKKVHIVHILVSVLHFERLFFSAYDAFGWCASRRDAATPDAWFSRCGGE